MTTIRCSRLPLLMACNASALSPLPRSNEDSDAATQGRLCHEIIEAYAVTGVEPDYEAFDSETSRLVRNGVEMISQIPHDTTWVAEMDVSDRISEDCRLTGHIDLAAMTKTGIVVADIKTGRKHDGDYRPQVRGYALCAQDPALSADCWILYLSDKSAENWQETPETLESFRADIVKHLEAPMDYVPGPHCDAHYCSLRQSCPEYNKQIHALALTLLSPKANELAMRFLPEKLMPDFYSQLNAVARVVEDAKALVRLRVESAGGRIDGDGYSLVMGPEGKVEDIDAAAAWQLLQDNLSLDEMVRVIKVVKGEVAKAIRAKAQRGHKDEAEIQFIQALRDAGAITTKPKAGSLRLEKRGYSE